MHVEPAASMLDVIAAQFFFYFTPNVYLHVFYMQGLCNTLPGFINGLLFCIFTKVVRETMFRGFKQCITCNNCASFRKLYHRYQETELVNAASMQSLTYYGSILKEDDIVLPPDPHQT